MKSKDTPETAEKVEDAQGVAPARPHGADRQGLGQKGWTETPDSRIGGDSEIEPAPKAPQEGA